MMEGEMDEMATEGELKGTAWDTYGAQDAARREGGDGCGGYPGTPIEFPTPRPGIMHRHSFAVPSPASPRSSTSTNRPQLQLEEDELDVEVHRVFDIDAPIFRGHERKPVCHRAASASLPSTSSFKMACSSWTPSARASRRRVADECDARDRERTRADGGFSRLAQSDLLRRRSEYGTRYECAMGRLSVGVGAGVAPLRIRGRGATQEYRQAGAGCAS
ncbi:hypothetical protein C8R45DRAFT_1029822 [Mycena sanguinolenta]|nr:hypothetical protein C8R45DRAFT_1029822 [Mycena sanguinolenta]